MKSSIAVLIVGINQWEWYTLPLIESIRTYEPDVEIVCIDNASDKPYPALEYVVSLSQRLSYADAINRAAERTKADWLLSLNNDVICQGKFADIIRAQDKNTIYGQQIIEEGGHVWLGNWLALIPRDVWQRVGNFDGKFEMCGFEDADYCVRAAALGIATKPIDLPFHHYWGATRWDLPGYSAARERNMDYFEQKHGYRLGREMRVTHG